MERELRPLQRQIYPEMHPNGDEEALAEGKRLGGRVITFQIQSEALDGLESLDMPLRGLQELGVSAAEAAQLGLTQAQLEALGATPVPAPELQTLLDVVPIAQTETHRGNAITLLSMERYAEGFLLHGRLSLREPLVPIWGMLREPALRFAAEDERGRTFHTWGHGVGTAYGSASVFTHTFAPALAPDAKTLRFELSEIGWRPPDLFNGPGPAREPEPGPWRFLVELGGGPSGGHPA